MPAEIRTGVRRLFRLPLRLGELTRDEMDDELRFHLESRVEQFIAHGMSPEQARVEALRRLGSTLPEARRRLQQSAQRKDRHMKFRERLDDLQQDLGYAARGLRRQPLFAAIAILTLAIGIGANTAIFSAVDALLLRPLPFPSPERLASIVQLPPLNPGAPSQETAVWSFRKYEIFRDAQTTLASTALWGENDVSVTGENAERLHGEEVTASYLGTLGVKLAVGHGFPLETDRHGDAARQVIISDAFWQRRYHADPAVIGQLLQLDAKSFEIVGVLPHGFRGLSARADVFTPITVASPDDLAQAWSLQYEMIGRLKPEVPIERAAADGRLAAKRVWELTGKTAGTLSGGTTGGAWSARVRPLDATRVSEPLRRSLLILLAAVAFVLLIACVNLANLLMGRAAARRQEIAIRLAIGAGRGRLVRLLLAETALLATLGGALSVLIAWWGTHILSAINPAESLQAQNLAGLGVAGFSSIHLDARALLFTFVITLAVGGLFGVAPALQSTRANLTEALKEGNTGRRGRSRLGGSRRVLVVTEVAFALILLAGSGLMIRSLAKLMDINAGFDPSHLLTFRLNVSRDQLPADSMPGFDETLLQRLGAVPGVTNVGITDCPPLAGGCSSTIMTFPDRPPAPDGQNAVIGVHFVSPGWFGTVHVPLKRGRLFDATDRRGGPRAIVINESAARKFWPGQDPIGKRARIYQGGFHADSGGLIVGVVGDVRFGTIESLPHPDAFLPVTQTAPQRQMFFLRTRGNPLDMASSIRRVVHEVAQQYPMYDIQSMDDRVATATAQSRFSATLLMLFALMALALAVMGIYGVMSFAVVQRTREIGIRMALGADRGKVLHLVLREGMALAVIGGVLGLGAALALTRVMRSLLYEVEPSDPSTYVGIALVLGVAALAASWLPARRAARVDPTEALRRG